MSNEKPSEREEAPEQPLPNFYVCIAPDEKPLVINFLRGDGNKLGELHLQLCAHCKEFVEAAGTRMRERCVSRVREMQAAIRKRNLARDESNRLDAYRINLLDEVMTQLQSLTLDGEKEQ